jgi:phage shock protein A
MKILDRMGLLLKADAHGVMDQLEERSLLLKQHLREAELELDRKRARLEAAEEQARQLDEEAVRREQETLRLDRDIELALAEGEEELARFAVRRLLPLRATLQSLRERGAELGDCRERLREKLQSQEVELEALRTRVRGKLSDMREREACAHVVDHPVADEEVELELLRRRSSKEATHSASGGPDEASGAAAGQEVRS